jgi:flagellar motor switch protein FliG
MSQLSKAAALLTSLGPDAENVLQRLRPEQAAQLRQAMQQLAGSRDLPALRQQALQEIQNLLRAEAEPPAEVSRPSHSDEVNQKPAPPKTWLSCGSVCNKPNRVRQMPGRC